MKYSSMNSNRKPESSSFRVRWLLIMIAFIFCVTALAQKPKQGSSGPGQNKTPQTQNFDLSGTWRVADGDQQGEVLIVSTGKTSFEAKFVDREGGDCWNGESRDYYIKGDFTSTPRDPLKSGILSVTIKGEMKRCTKEDTVFMTDCKITSVMYETTFTAEATQDVIYGKRLSQHYTYTPKGGRYEDCHRDPGGDKPLDFRLYRVVQKYKISAKVFRIRYEPFGLECPDNILPPTKCPGDLWELVRVQVKKAYSLECLIRYSATWTCSTNGKVVVTEKLKPANGPCPDY